MHKNDIEYIDIKKRLEYIENKLIKILLQIILEINIIPHTPRASAPNTWSVIKFLKEER
jgi:hypothetical protein